MSNDTAYVCDFVMATLAETEAGATQQTMNTAVNTNNLLSMQIGNQLLKINLSTKLVLQHLRKTMIRKTSKYQLQILAEIGTFRSR